jgi:hypothetical protein
VEKWSAFADYGIYRVETLATATSQPLPTNPAVVVSPAQTVATAFSRDLITFDAPGLTGQSGHFYASFALSGSFSIVTGSPYGSGYDDVRVRAVLRNIFDGQLWTQAGVSGGQISYRLLPGGTTEGSSEVTSASIGVDFPIVFGRQYALQIEVAGSSLAYAEPTAPPYVNDPNLFTTATTSFGHTATWQGISSVTGPGGQAVEGWTLSSVSGTPWASAIAEPVPEPASSLLFCGGLATLAALMRARPSRRRTTP